MARCCAPSRAPLARVRACTLRSTAWLLALVAACHTALASVRCVLAARCHFCSATILACWSEANLASKAAASCWWRCVASRHRSPSELSSSATSFSFRRAATSPRCSRSCRREAVTSGAGALRAGEGSWQGRNSQLRRRAASPQKSPFGTTCAKIATSGSASPRCARRHPRAQPEGRASSRWPVRGRDGASSSPPGPDCAAPTS